MLNDKHIEQHAGYLLEKADPENEHYIRQLPQYIFEVMIEMYKKGYKDCMDDLRITDPVNIEILKEKIKNFIEGLK